MRKIKEKQTEEQMEKEAYGNERFGIPKDCTKKQKFSGVKLAFYMLVVASVCCLGYVGIRTLRDRYIPEMSFDKSAHPIVYVKGKNLIVRPHQAKEGVVLAGDLALYAEDGGRVVSLAEKGKVIFFAENRTSENTYDLYCCSQADLKKNAEKKALIATQIENYQSDPEGKFVLYLKNGELYFWNKKQTYQISSEVTEYHLSRDGEYVVYYEEGAKVYVRPLSQDAEPTLVDVDVEKVISEKKTYHEIYYLKQNALFFKELNEERVLLAEQVEDAFLLGDILYYIKQEPYTWALEEIFLDDRAEYDETIEKPTNTGLTVSDAEVEENEKRYAEKVFRDSIRTYFTENPIVTERYHLYRVQGEESVLVDSGLFKSEVTFHSCNTTVLYEKFVGNQDKMRISTVTSIEEAQKEVARVTENAEVGMAVLTKDKAPYLAMEEVLKGRVEISLDGKYLYCLEDIGKDKKGVLVRYTIGAKELKGRTELCQVASDFTVDGADSSAVIVFDGNRMGICMDKKYTHLAENRGPDFFYVDKTLYFLDEYDPDTQTGKLMCFRNEKEKQIDSGVHSFDVRNLKTVVYIKNYSRELGFGELYQKEGSRTREKIDICVRNILH